MCLGFLWALIIFIWFRPIFYPGYFFAHQDLNYFEFAARSFFFEMLKTGHLTFLYPLNSLGSSMAAIPLHSFYYPMNLTYLFLESFSAFKVNFFVHFMLSATGWYLALRALKLSKGAAVFAATIFIASGIMWTAHLRIESQSPAWTGFAVLFFVKSLAKGCRHLALLSGVMAGFIYLGGNVDLVPLALFQPLLLVLFFKDRFSDQKMSGKIILLNFILQITACLFTLFPVLYQGARMLPFSVRSYGFTSFVSLIYSFSPVKLFDFAFPGLVSSHIHLNHPLAEQMKNHVADWYPTIVIGMVASVLWVIGLIKFLAKKPGLIYIFLMIVMLSLSFGFWLPGGEWLWGNVFPLTHFRYPGKFLRHVFILGIPCIALGYLQIEEFLAKKISWPRIANLSIILICISLVEIYFHLPSAKALKIDEFRLYPALNPLFDKKSPDYSAVHRILVCANGLWGTAEPGVTAGFLNHLWRLSYLKTGANADSPIVRSVGCPATLKMPLAKWLGISHVISIYDRDKTDFKKISEDLDLISDPRYAEFSLFKIKGSGPDLALFSTAFSMEPFIKNISGNKELHSIEVGDALEKMDKGVLLVEPSYYLDENGDLVSGAMEQYSRLQQLQQELGKQENSSSHMFRSIPLELANAQDIITLEQDFPEAGLLSLPWQFIPGWRLEVNERPQPIYRINDTTLGFFVPKGRVKATLFFLPPHFLETFLVSFAFVLSVIVLSLKRRFFSC